MPRNLNKVINQKTSDSFDRKKNVIIGECDPTFLVNVLNAIDENERQSIIRTFSYDHGWDITDPEEIEFFFGHYRKENFDHSSFDYECAPTTYFTNVYLLKARKVG